MTVAWKNLSCSREKLKVEKDINTCNTLFVSDEHRYVDTNVSTDYDVTVIYLG